MRSISSAGITAINKSNAFFSVISMKSEQWLLGLDEGYFQQCLEATDNWQYCMMGSHTHSYTMWPWPSWMSGSTSCHGESSGTIEIFKYSIQTSNWKLISTFLRVISDWPVTNTGGSAVCVPSYLAMRHWTVPPDSDQLHADVPRFRFYWSYFFLCNLYGDKTKELYNANNIPEEAKVRRWGRTVCLYV